MGAPLCSRPPPASGSRQLGRSRCPAAAAQRQQQQLPACSRAAAAKDSSGGGSSGGDAAVQQPCSQAVEQQQAGSQASLPLLQRAARAAAASAAAAVLALGSLAPPPAAAVLASPRAQLPRSADVALRRSIPAFNADVAEVQDRLEAVQFKLRIPQRKPWGGMADDVSSAAAIVADAPRMLAGVLPGDMEAAQGLVADIGTTLERLARAIEVKDPDRTSVRVANALEQVAALELLQAPGLPYQLPRAVAGYPALAGRAVVELEVEKAGGQRAFVDPNSSAGPQKRAVLRLVLDGYSAPITAANLVENVRAGLYNGAELSVSGNAVLVGAPSAAAAAAADGDDVSYGVRSAGAVAAAADSPSAGEAVAVSTIGGSAGGRRGAPAALPLEVLALGEFEPLYRSTLDVRGGELPVLPLSIYGAVAMAHLPDAAGGSAGYVSGTQFFIYKFDRQQAGLAGLSFDEGEFGVCGYAVKGLDAVEKLESGDRVVAARVVSGLDKLVR